jgi:hypothetical protein
MKTLIQLFAFILITSLTFQLKAQCPGSSSCGLSEIYCSASVFNGMVCSNPMMANDIYPYPNLCFGVGVPNNLMWWSFIGEGGPLSISFLFDISDCTIPFGIQAGIFEGDCSGNTVWDCDASCNTSAFTLRGTTKSCETYYMWVDGCHGDVCDFMIEVSGNAGNTSLPRPLPLPVASAQPCLGITEFCFPGVTSGCDPVITWAVDGIPTGNIGDECIEVDFDNTSPHVICVVATLGNPFDPSGICDQEIACITVVPDSLPARQGRLMNICPEDQPFVWNGMRIDSSCVNPPCTVRVQEKSTGCIVDSIRQIKLLSPPDTGFAAVVACPDEDYVHWDGTIVGIETCDTVIYTKTIDGCDSIYHLFIERPILDVLWHIDVTTGELCPEVYIISACDSSTLDDVSYDLVWEVYGHGICDQTFYGDSCLTFIYNQNIMLNVLVGDSSFCDAHQFNAFYIWGDSPVLPEISGSEFICEGDSTLLTASGSFSTFIWEGDSISGHTFWVTDPGTYCVSAFRDSDSCWVEACFFVDQSSISISDSIISADDGSGSGSIELVLGGTHEPFEIVWANGDTSHILSNLSAGNYSVTIRNSLGCERTYVITVPMTTATQDSEVGKLLIFPNPNAGMFKLEDCQSCLVEIWDARGVQVLSVLPDNQWVDASILTGGVYWIKMTSDIGDWRVGKLVVTE